MERKITPTEAFRKNRNNNGRPKKSIADVRDYFVRVRLNASEYYSTKAKARQAGMKMSEYIRSALNSSVVKERFGKNHNKMILLLTSALNNLNQLTKRAHQAGYFAVDGELKPLIKDIDNTIKKIEYDS